MRRFRVLAFAILAAAHVPPAVVAASDRATVATKAGETLEGDFKGATDVELTLEVAGQPIRVPLAKVKYVSFVGSLTTASSPAPVGKPGTADDAFAALAEIEEPLQVGVLRPQYADLLQKTLPRVLAFLKNAEASWHPDAQLALRKAVERYQAPLGSSGWSLASIDWAEAKANIEYARKITITDPPSGHRETPTVTPLTLGTKVSGRIGSGDATLPEGFEVASTPLADRYSFVVTKPAKVRFTMSGAVCRPNVVVADSAGKRVKYDSPPSRLDGTFTTKLQAGTYAVWAACAYDGGVTTYDLVAEELR